MNQRSNADMIAALTKVCTENACAGVPVARFDEILGRPGTCLPQRPDNVDHPGRADCEWPSSVASKRLINPLQGKPVANASGPEKTRPTMMGLIQANTAGEMDQQTTAA